MKLASNSRSVIELGDGGQHKLTVTARWTSAAPDPIFGVVQQVSLPAEELIALLEEAIITIRAFHKNE